MYPQGVCRSRKPACAGLRLRYISRFLNRSLGAKDPPFSRRRFIQSFPKHPLQFHRANAPGHAAGQDLCHGPEGGLLVVVAGQLP